MSSKKKKLVNKKAKLVSKNKFSIKNVIDHNFYLLIIFLIFFFCLSSFIFGQRPKVTQVLGASDQLNHDKIIQLINLERAKKGIGPIVSNNQLQQAAERKGQYMFTHDYWAHMAPDGTSPWSFVQAVGYRYQSAGENLARDFHTEEDLIKAWMASPTHRANILNGSFNETGIIVLDGIINDQPVLLIVNFFAQPKNSLEVFNQVAIYDDQNQALVLAGEVMPQGTLLARRKYQPSALNLILGFLILGFVLFIFKALQQKPYRRRKKH